MPLIVEVMEVWCILVWLRRMLARVLGKHLCVFVIVDESG